MNNLVYTTPLGGISYRADGLFDLDLIFKVTAGLAKTSYSQIKLVCTVCQEYLLGFL